MRFRLIEDHVLSEGLSSWAEYLLFYWPGVHGELMTFANPGFDLPPINRLEAFDPNGRCVYTRVLAAVETNDLIRPVWLCHCNPGHDTERITSGKWTQKCRNDIFESRVNKQPQTGVL